MASIDIFLFKYRKFIIAFTIGLTLSLFALLTLLVWIQLEPSPVYRVEFNRNGLFGRPHLSLRGQISEPMYAEARKYVGTDVLSADYILDVSINSNGGNGKYSTLLLDLLSQRHSVVWLHPDTACISACVQLFANLPRFASPNAVLGFHQGRIENSNMVKFIKLLGLGPESETHPAIMRPWIEKISPKLLAFIDSCSKNPLETDDGIGLRWSEIEEIIEGKNSFTCDDKQREPLSIHFEKVFKTESAPWYSKLLRHLY